MVDIDNYINKLNAEIEHLKNINQSLRNEIRIQRYEIAGYKDTIKTLLEWDKPPEHNNQMDFHA
jgi:peptidoglycan hydrolase CwlO-like protein